MPCAFYPLAKKNTKNYVVSFNKLYNPIHSATASMPPLQSKGNRPLQMSFDEHLRALVYFHLEEHVSAQHLLQALEEDEFARYQIAPKEGIKKSSFSEATNTRGLEQFMYVFEYLQKQAAHVGN